MLSLRFSFSRFRVAKCDPKSARDRRTLLITEPNGSVPPSPANADPPEHSTGPKSQVSGFSVKKIMYYVYINTHTCMYIQLCSK